MIDRNFSLDAYFNAMAAAHEPKYRFSGKTEADWRTWREELLPAVKATLGRAPGRVDLNAVIEAEWEHDGLIKQRVVFDVEEGLACPAYVFRPAKAKRPLPAILACHGHGPHGKDGVMGNRGDSERKDVIDQHNYDYGLQMAKAGYAVIAIDWRGFGERDDREKPNNNLMHPGDQCNLNYLRATLVGMTVLGMNIHDGMRAIDYLCEREFVDAQRIGCMGLSFGGTMATWMSICDERIKATDIICYSDRFAEFGMRFINFCGSQITPGLYELCDVPDLQGLIAPRPVLVEIGSYDRCFTVDAAMSCYHELEKIYAAAGVSERLHLELFDGGHKWAGKGSYEFFGKYL